LSQIPVAISESSKSSSKVRFLLSTKIYSAYRVRKGADMWDVVHDIRIQGSENVKEALKKFGSTHLSAVREDTDLFKKALDYYSHYERSQEITRKLARIKVATDILKRFYRINSTSSIRSPYNFDVSVGFRQYKGRIYVIPYCDWTMGKVLDFLKKDHRLTDFHYQNQTDKPKHISEKSWDRRADVWNGMDKDGLFQDVLCLDICRFDMYWQFDPSHDLVKEVLGADPTKGVDPEPTGSEQ